MINEKIITLYDYVLPLIAIENKFLISKEQLLELTNSRNLIELRKNLVSYYPKLSKIAPSIDLERMHFIFHEDFIAKVNKIIQNSPYSARSFLMNFLIEFEIENLKTVLRSKLINKSISEISDKIHWQIEDYTGNKEIFNRIIKENDFKIIFNLLKKTEYGEFIKKAEKKYRETNSLLYINTFLDYGQIVKMERGLGQLSRSDKLIASQYLNILIEYFNYMILFRGKSFNLTNDEISEFFIPTTSSKMLKILNTLLTVDTVSSLLDLIRTSNFRETNLFLSFPDSTNSYFDILNYLERNFYQKSFQLVEKLKIESTFSISAPLTFILLKKFQLRDLIQISTAVDYNLSKEILLERIILLSE